MKTLNQFLGEQTGYRRVKSPDEQRFVDKHVVQVTDDKNGNDDDVFKAAKVKKADRRKDRHGYEPGEDESVYEAENKYAAAFGPEGTTTKKKNALHWMDQEDKSDAAKARTPEQHKARLNKLHADAENLKKTSPALHAYAKNRATAYKVYHDLEEEAEQIDESAKVAAHLIKRYGENVRKSHVRSAANDFGVGFVALSHAVRKKLGVNRLEEEQIDELSTDTLRKYREKARLDAFDADAVDDERRLRKRSYHHNLAGKKIIKRGDTLRKEEVEIIEGLMHDRYERSHGKKARGTGSWAFTTQRYGSPKQSEMHFTSGQKSLSDAHKEAAAKLGTKHLYVMEDIDIDTVLDEALSMLMSIDEKTLTPAEMKKREEVVKAIKRENPKMDKSMAYAVATKTAKRVAEGVVPTADEPSEHDKKMAQKVRDLLAKEKKPVKEEAEDLDELSTDTLQSYKNKNNLRRKPTQAGGSPEASRTVTNRIRGAALARDKMKPASQAGARIRATEEVELDEKTLTRAEMRKREEVVKAVKKANPKMDKSMAYAIATKTAKRVAEDFAASIADLADHTQGIMVETFERLNEENKQRFVTACQTEEGLEKMVAFAIENRGR